jgi:hypothetical protein
MTQRAPIERSPQTTSVPEARRWLIFVHQLPSHPSKLRVSTWRRLQQMGALPLKQAVYVLPDTAAAREDFEWLKTEVTGAGGEARVFTADHVDTWSDDELVEAFRRSRQEAYDALAREVQRGTKRTSSAQRLVNTFRERLAAIERIDFFGSAGRDRVVTLLRQLEERGSSARKPKAPGRTIGPGDAPAYQGRLWMTRPRPGVDRMSSAWLIRRFIDRQARFGFASDRAAVPADGVPFDMFGVDFSHQNDGCTFETLCAVFGIDDPAVSRIAAIVHDLDLKENRFGAPECGTVGALIDGLRLTYEQDDVLLDQGMSVFESLYRAFDQSARTSGPRVVAKSARRSAKGKKR